MSSLLSGIANKYFSSTVGKVISTGSYTDAISTTSGDEFIPEYTKTDGQKRYQTNGAIPAMPRPKTMFFVYFNINAKAANLIAKKKSLIEYLSKEAKYNQTQNACLANEAELQKIKSGNAVTDTVNNGISQKITDMAKSLSDMKTKVINKLTGNTPTNTEFTADYICDRATLRQLSFELSKYVKSIDKPSITYGIKEYNEYNRRRLCYDNRSFNDIKINFYDVKNNPVQQFFISYLKMIDNTFLCKTSSHWKKQIQPFTYRTDTVDWGFDLDSNFRLIDSISIIEMFMDKMIVYTLENPVLQQIDFGSDTIGDFSPSDLTVTFKYEGVTNDLLVGESASPAQPYNCKLTESASEIYLKSILGKDINEDIATFIQKRYKSGLTYGVETATSFIKGILDADKSDRWSVFQSQLLDTGRSLGFADEINMVNQAKDMVDNYKNSENKGQYVLKAVDDPSSLVGTLTASNITTGSTSIINLF